MSGTLRIGELAVDLVIDRAAPDPAAVRRHCADAVGHRLASALDATLGRWCDRDDPSIWLLRRVELDVATSTAFAPHELSLDVARSLAVTLGAVLVGDGDGLDSIRFADAAALLARFLIDAANGDAWSRWYYRRFRGLRMLPVSVAVRTAVCDVPSRGLAALRGMQDCDLVRVLGALSAADAALVRATFSALPDADELPGCAERCLAAWPGCRGARLRDDQRALMLVVRASTEDRVGRSLDETATTICEVGSRLAQHETPTFIARHGEAIFDDVRVATEVSAKMALWAPALRERALATLTPAPAIAAIGAGMGGATPFGGAFLLLSTLDELMRAPTEAAARAGVADEAIALARLLVLGACLEPSATPDTFGDPWLRFACGVPGDCVIRTPAIALQRLAGTDALLDALVAAGARVPRGELARFAKPAGRAARWQRATRDVAYRVLRAFARRLPGFAESGCAYLRRNFLDVAAKVEIEPERVAVTVSRAPLHLVLSLTGITRATFTLSFGDGRPFSLFAGE